MYAFEGVGDEVLVSFGIISAFGIPILIYLVNYMYTSYVNYGSTTAERTSVNGTTTGGGNLLNNMPARSTGDGNEQCPICLSELQYGTETNCGHTFCAQCMMTHWSHRNLMGPAQCPLCRQQWLDYIRDMPTVFRHLWTEFFSLGGLVFMFRIRIIVCFIAGFMYIASPLDIIPEAVFGFFGLIDDIFVFFLIVIYVSIIYRQVIANRS